MRRKRSRGTDGFTLIEMMIVVAIIGVLASAAIPAFVRYMRNARNVEGVHNVSKMADSSRAYYEAHSRFNLNGCTSVTCAAAAPPTPSLGAWAVCQLHAGVYPASYTAEFKHAQWQKLLFQPEGNIRFEYYFYGYNHTNPASSYAYHRAYRYSSCNAGKQVVVRAWIRISAGAPVKQGPYLMLNW